MQKLKKTRRKQTKHKETTQTHKTSSKKNIKITEIQDFQPTNLRE